MIIIPEFVKLVGIIHNKTIESNFFMLTALAFALMESITGIVFLIYGLCILGLSYGWLKLKRQPILHSSLPPRTRVSVVVAIRNEEKNIHSLLKHLSIQEYPRHLYEIILANDHSQDATLTIINKWKHESDSNILVVHNTSREAGKKAALKNGIDKATGKLILTTDADCIMGKCWIKAMVSFYEKEKSHMILGPVFYRIHKKKAFEHFQALEFISLLATSAGSASLNRPLFCNAANMAFSRKIYKEIKDPLSSETASGDDTMLLLSIKEQHPGKIRFNKNPHAIVETFPEKTLTGFWNQRKRWVSKSKYYRDFDILAVSILVFGTNLLLIIFFVLMLFNSLFMNYFIVISLLKILIDSCLLFPLILYYKKYFLLLSYLPSQLVYPFYVTATALGGKFSGFEWNNRYYHVN